MNRLRAILLCPWMLCASASAQNGHDVTGRVVDSQTGKGIEHARVIADVTGYQPDKEHSIQVALTDQEGSFAFRNLPDDIANIWTEKPGYLGGKSRQESNFHWVYKQSGSIQMSMTRQAVIEGRFMDEAGRGIECQVILWRQTLQNGRQELSQVSSPGAPTTNEFRFYGLEAGTYFVQVLSFLGASTATYPSVFYPHATDLSSAKPIVLQAGQQEHIEFQLQQVRAYKIRGHYTGISTSPPISFYLPGSSPSGAGGFITADAKTQTFEILRVPPGVYVLAVAGKTQTITVEDRDVDGLEFNVTPPGK